jgi:hypothetical protein
LSPDQREGQGRIRCVELPVDIIEGRLPVPAMAADTGRMSCNRRSAAAVPVIAAACSATRCQRSGSTRTS